jgi:uncharacterized protein YciI
MSDEPQSVEPFEIPPRMTVYYMGLLLRGTTWSPEETPEAERMQEAHMANIRRMAALGKLVMAGPFLDDGPIRGIYIFKVDSLAEALALTESDPAVQAGRLKFELHPWLVEKGILP